MAFQPDIKQELAIGAVPYHIAEHPYAPGVPYGQEGRTAVVYQLVGEEEKRAFKVFKPRFRVPALVSLSRRLAPFASLPGLRVCSRVVLTPQQDGYVLADHPDLLYAVVMPWIEGPSWMEVLLNNQTLSQEQSLAIARALAGVLAGMEQEGLAHCDLSGPNLLLPVLADDGREFASSSTDVGSQLGIELVDVEQMYGPDLRKPDFLPTGSSGYAHSTAPEGMWSPDADRFAGALLLAEILGWCDERARNMAWGESYFDPKEMQQLSERYSVLTSVLGEMWGEGVARLFEQAWRSGNSVECPTFGEWMMKLPRTVTVAATDALAQATTSTTGPGQPPPMPTQPYPDAGAQPAIPDLAAIFEEIAESKPVAQAGAVAASPHLERFFDEGLAAYGRGEWTAARELFGAVVSQNRGYARDGLYAAELLAEAEKRLAPQSTLKPNISPSIVQAQPVPVAYEGVTAGPSASMQPTPAYSVSDESTPIQTSAVAPAKRARASILLPALVVLTLLLFGGAFVLFGGQGGSQGQEAAAQATVMAIEAQTAQAVADADNTAVAETAVVADATVQAEQTASAVSAQQTEVAQFADATNTVLAADVTSTAQANAGSTAEANVMATREADVAATASVVQATVSAIPLSAQAITLENRDKITSLYTLEGHSDKVYSLVFSPDGQTLASGSSDGSVRLWKAPDGAPGLVIPNLSPVHDLAYSPDSIGGHQTLAIATDNGATIWDAVDGLLLRSLQGESSLTIAYSPNAVYVATGTFDSEVLLWRSIDGALLRTMSGHTGYITEVAFSPDGTILASGSDDKTVRLWSVADGTLLRTLVGHTHRIQGVVFAPDGQTLITSSGDDTIRQWRVSDGTPLSTASDAGPTLGMAFSPDFKILAAAGSWENVVRLWRMPDGARLGNLEGHTAGVTVVAFSPDGAGLASASEDKTIRVWGVSGATP